MVDSRMKFPGSFYDLAALFIKETPAIAQLCVAADPQTKAHEFTVATKAMLLPQRLLDPLRGSPEMTWRAWPEVPGAEPVVSLAWKISRGY
jgi:hypothetical protein